MKYYVIYAGKDIGWYKTTHWVVAITGIKELAEDFCKKYGCNYVEEDTGDNRRAPDWLRLEPAKGEK